MLKELLLAEFDQEIAKTRPVLERVPERKLGWKPHEKSPTMGWLLQHLTDVASWVAPTLRQDTLDLTGFEPPKPATAVGPVLAKFEEEVKTARAALEATDDEALHRIWTMTMGGKTLVEKKKIDVLREFILSHHIHHRAQMGMYLRLNDIPVPAIYGPSADEGSFG